MDRIIIEFPDKRSRDSFAHWLSCQGEQGFFDWEAISVTDDRPGSASRKDFGKQPVVRMTYPWPPPKGDATIKAEF